MTHQDYDVYFPCAFTTTTYAISSSLGFPLDGSAMATTYITYAGSDYFRLYGLRANTASIIDSNNNYYYYAAGY